ncbi:MAG: hypothetical protein QOI12_5287 [Alphaproteobacteria bacterium]|jgi:hypothetical protein|nr:hypothetical protein [Alphaproteobacteria bacterium]
MKFATVLVTVVVLALCPNAAQALVKRAFLSANGSDASDCSRPTPCRTLAAAVLKTVAGGEIYVLDPAGYGPVVITSSISIFNDGVGSVGILVPAGGTGVTINAGPADKISLRGFIIEGAGVGANGIVFNSGQSLTVENSVIRNLVDYGINFLPTGSSMLDISNTYVGNNGDSGICLRPVGPGAVRAILNRVELYRNGTNGIVVDGVSVVGTLWATAVDSMSAYNGTNGFAVLAATASSDFSSAMGAEGSGVAPISLTLLRSVAARNATGLFSEGPEATLRASQSAVVGNAIGWASSGGGLVLSAADNTIEGNAAGESAPSSYSTK